MWDDDNYPRSLYCEMCGKEMGKRENAYIHTYDRIVMCAKCFREEFDREYTLTEKAEFAGYTVMDASDYFDM
ncbi:MAG TPA: hypothetical protein GX701_04490 [Clostridiales bacterium]|nr:hypothetical protein [Clostridiales bacterium]